MNQLQLGMAMSAGVYSVGVFLGSIFGTLAFLVNLYFIYLIWKSK